jgi:drug/metabolite transporter (DMT)-like permease
VLLGLAAALAAAGVFGGSAILQAIGSRRVADDSGLSPRTAALLLRQPAFLAALVLNLLGFLLHLVAVRLLPLFLAQAGIAASLAVTALLAMRIFHDQLSRIDWAAIAAVCVGLALLTAAAGQTGQERATTAMTVTLYAVAAGMVVGGLVATRLRGPVAAGGLSLLAGLGFANTALSARLLPELTVSSVLGSPVAYALPLSGALAFLLYSLALQRSSVTVATAPMIVVQTAGPAIVGVLLLGDAVRSGWAASALVGFVLTAAGAVALVRFEGVRQPTRTRDPGDTCPHDHDAVR